MFILYIFVFVNVNYNTNLKKPSKYDNVGSGFVETLGGINIIYKQCSLIALSMHFQFKHWFTFGSLNIEVMIIWQFIQPNLTHGS